MKRERKGVQNKQGRLRDLSGNLVSSEERAETLAEYLERVQWAVRSTSLNPYTSKLGPELPVDVGNISEHEVVKAGRQLRRGKASGVDEIPPEFWKAICVQGTPACKWAVELCDKCWETGSVPEDWHQSRVASIFKKGDVADCGSYRPISLLSIGYKLLQSSCCIG